MAIDVILRSPSDHLTKFRRALRSARLLMAGEEWEKAVSAAYYAGLHAAQALLATQGLTAQTHRGTQQLLGLYFVKPGLLPPDLAAELGRRQADREIADYGPAEQIGAAGAGRAMQATAELLLPMLALLVTRDPDASDAVDAVRAELDRLVPPHPP